MNTSLIGLVCVCQFTACISSFSGQFVWYFDCAAQVKCNYPQITKTAYFKRRTYCLWKGRIVASWCRGTQWGQGWPRVGVQTRHQPCNRYSGQSESWTDHTMSIRTGYNEGSSVCSHQPWGTNHIIHCRRTWMKLMKQSKESLK